MSYAAERWARAQRVGNARAKQVLVELANCHNGKTGKCTPGIKYLHEVTELKEDTISTATNFLQSKGFIKKTYVAVEKGRAISYELLGFNPQEWERKKTEDSTENGLTQNRGNPESVGPPETGATDSPENGGTGTPEFGGETGNKNRERNREVMCAPSGNSSANAAVASAQAQTPYPEDFDQSLFDEARSMGSEPNVEITIEAPAPAPQKRKAAPRRKPATPCPFDADASIPDEYKAIAEKVGIGNPQQVFSAFVNHALATDRRLTVWPAGFRTWCLNELRYHPLQTAKPKPLHQRTADDYNW
jgi:hypothetical protein|nr:MAG TPA: helix-turn-helix domain protein [Caudoviricetes sp.]